MENQRRRFEKEREDAFSYGGFTFAKETLNLIDNLERSKQILESDEALKDSLMGFPTISVLFIILSCNGIPRKILLANFEDNLFADPRIAFCSCTNIGLLIIAAAIVTGIVINPPKTITLSILFL